MKNFILTSAIVLTLSTSVHTTAYNTEKGSTLFIDDEDHSQNNSKALRRRDLHLKIHSLPSRLWEENKWGIMQERIKSYGYSYISDVSWLFDNPRTDNIKSLKKLYSAFSEEDQKDIFKIKDLSPSEAMELIEDLFEAELKEDQKTGKVKESINAFNHHYFGKVEDSDTPSQKMHKSITSFINSIYFECLNPDDGYDFDHSKTTSLNIFMMPVDKCALLMAIGMPDDSSKKLSCEYRNGKSIITKQFKTVDEYIEALNPSQDDYTLAEKLIRQYPKVLNYQNFGAPEDINERRKVFLNPEKKFNYLDQKIISRTLEKAKEIYDFTKQGDRIVIFGASPVFYGRAIEALNSDESRRIITFPFSGSADSSRDGSYCTKNVSLSEMITHKRVKFLEERLDKLNLLKKNDHITGTTYFIDLIGSCSGPSFVVETILRNVRKEDCNFTPSIEFISLNNLSYANEKCAKILIKGDVNDGDSVMLTLPDIKKNWFQIPCHIMSKNQEDIYVYGKTYCEGWRIVPNFKLMHHSKEYQDRLDIQAWLDRVPERNIFLEYFDVNIKEMLNGNFPENNRLLEPVT